MINTPKLPVKNKKTISVRLNEDAQSILNEFTNKYGMSQGSAVAYFATLGLEEWQNKNNFKINTIKKD